MGLRCIAKCPNCGKIWHCSNETFESTYNELKNGDFEWISFDDKRYKHCRTCRCNDCHKKGMKNEEKEEKIL